VFICRRARFILLLPCKWDFFYDLSFFRGIPCVKRKTKLDTPPIYMLLASFLTHNLVFHRFLCTGFPATSGREAVKSTTGYHRPKWTLSFFQKLLIFTVANSVARHQTLSRDPNTRATVGFFYIF